MKDENGISRRGFINRSVALGALSALGISALVSACNKEAKTTETVELDLPPMLDQAPDGAPIKAGLIGCGGRGTGAAFDFLSAGPNLQIVAIGDLFQDRVDDCRKKLKDEKQIELTDAQCFVGFDAFKKVIASEVDLIILATPPHFRAEHFDAAIQARKHVFMEKPVAVDPTGIRTILAAGKNAAAAGLCVVAGTQRRHQRDYVETYKQIKSGIIGDIVSANCYWNQSKLWHKNRDPKWTDMETMIRDWVNWTWLSGDHITEQHVHNIDVINWFTGKHPAKAVGFGSRLRRPTGDQYDNFSVDFTYDEGFHMHSMCRQINDCVSNVSEFIRGTKGYTNCQNKIFDNTGKVIWEYQYPKDEKGESTGKVAISPYVQEHIDLVTAIRTGKVVNEAENVAHSTLTAIMGRISAYTGKETSWDEILNLDMKLGPAEYVLGKSELFKGVAPIAGSAPEV